MPVSAVAINDRAIGPGQPPYVIAEIGGNFMTFEEGREFIDAAIAAGVDAVKLQTYRADTLASKKAMFDMPNVGRTSQYELFKKYELGEDVHQQIFDYARQKGITVFSTPSHATDADFLEKFGVPAFKIGSDDSYNIPFIEYIGRKGKPTILSTGMSTMAEVLESTLAFLATGNKQLIVLHCVTQYPTKPEGANLRAMVTMQRELGKLGVPVGWSDHIVGIDVSLMAVALGACVIEKHFTLDKSLPGPEHQLSADPAEMKQLVTNTRNIHSALRPDMSEEERLALVTDILGDSVLGRIRASLGSPEKKPSEEEKITVRNNRKSIVAEMDIPKGAVIDKGMVEIKRPGTGIAPKFITKMVGMRAKHDIQKEDILQWEDVE